MNRDEPTTWQTRQAQYDAVCARASPTTQHHAECAADVHGFLEEAG